MSSYIKHQTQPTRSVAAQTLSQRSYAAVSGAGLFFTIVILWYYVSEAPQLVRDGIEDRVFYILLGPFALSLTTFVFGAMKSYANYKIKHLSGTLTIGGPAVFFALIVIGGFYLTTPADSFSVTVRLIDEGGKPVKFGKVSLRLGQDTRSAQVTPNGEVDFKEIPRKYRHTEPDLAVEARGYRLLDPLSQKLSPVITLKLMKINGEVADKGPADTFAVTVRLFGPGGEAITRGVVTLYLGSDARTAPIAQNGEANFKEVPLKFRGTAVRVRVDAADYQMTGSQQRPSLDDVVDVNLIKAERAPRVWQVSAHNCYPQAQRKPKGVKTPWSAHEIKSCTAEDIRLKRC